ncbi:MAG: hypothetical protein AAGH76_16110 [Pseudomonadota bacterium]
MTPTTAIVKGSIAFIALVSLGGCISFGDEQSRVAVPGPKPLKIEVPAAGRVELVLANGDATVVAAAIDHVEVSVTVRCPQDSTRCRERAGNAKLTSINTTDSARFELAGSLGSGAEVTTRVRVPIDRALDVQMKYGALAIENHAGDLNVQMTAGDIDIKRPEHDIGAVDLRARFGDATLYNQAGAQEGRRPLLVGSTVEWVGDGRRSVAARIRFGDIDLSLTD